MKPAHHPIALARDDFAALIPIPLKRKVRVNCISRILPRDREQHADRSDKRVAESILDCRFDADDRRPASCPAIDRVAVGAPGSGVNRDEFEVISKAPLVIKEMLED